MRTYYIYVQIDDTLHCMKEFDSCVGNAIGHILNDYVGHRIKVLRVQRFVKGGGVKELKNCVGKEYYTRKVV